MLNLDFLERFSDDYLKKDEGKGVLLAGVALGMLARAQIQPDQRLDNAPLFKQLSFGKMQMRDLRRHLARVPELTRAYRISAPRRLERLAAEAGALLLKSGATTLGVDGNFTFTTAFLNARQYYATIFDIGVSKESADESKYPWKREFSQKGS